MPRHMPTGSAQCVTLHIQCACTDQTCVIANDRQCLTTPVAAQYNAHNFLLDNRERDVHTGMHTCCQPCVWHRWAMLTQL